MYSRLLSALFILLFLVSCGKSLPEIEHLDLEAWKKDKNACGTYRADKIAVIRSQKEKFLALKESQIIELLGRPDRNELYKRNQKFFQYNLEAASSCENAKSDALQLVIRFNAMGLAKEVAIE